jgi:hypothetical protein
MSDTTAVDHTGGQASDQDAGRPVRKPSRGASGGTAAADAADGSTGNGLVRVTVNLAPAAVHALDHLCDTTGYSKTDVINRALQVYEVWHEVADRSGGTVSIRHADGEIERIRLL